MKKKKLNFPLSQISQINNELSCFLFKRTSYTAKKKLLKVSKTV